MIDKVRIDDNTEAFAVPSGIVVMRTVHAFNEVTGVAISTHMLHVPMSEKQRDEFMKEAKRR